MKRLQVAMQSSESTVAGKIKWSSRSPKLKSSVDADAGRRQGEVIPERRDAGDGERQLHHQREPEHRHRLPEEREGRHRVVDRRVGLERRNDAEADADRERDRNDVPISSKVAGSRSRIAVSTGSEFEVE